MKQKEENLVPLSQAPIGAPSQIHGFLGDADLNQRLREIGFYEGAHVVVKSRMPFRGPLVIELDQCSLALRFLEASSIEVAAL